MISDLLVLLKFENLKCVLVVVLRHTNRKITVVSICTEYIARGISTDQECEFGALTEGNISCTDQKNNYLCIYYQDMLKTYIRETKLFEFSQDMER